jgi:hypothetical protein
LFSASSVESACALLIEIQAIKTDRRVYGRLIHPLDRENHVSKLKGVRRATVGATKGIPRMFFKRGQNPAHAQDFWKTNGKECPVLKGRKPTSLEDGLFKGKEKDPNPSIDDHSVQLRSQ